MVLNIPLARTSSMDPVAALLRIKCRFWCGNLRIIVSSPLPVRRTLTKSDVSLGSILKILYSEGLRKSASTRSTRLRSCDRASARLAATVDLPSFSATLVTRTTLAFSLSMRLRMRDVVSLQDSAYRKLRIGFVMIMAARFVLRLVIPRRS